MKSHVNKMLREYARMKKELSVLEFQLQNFKGISQNDIILSMSLSIPSSERVQSSMISDKTCTVAMNYRKVAEQLNDELYNSYFSQYEELKEELDFFEYSIGKLSGSLPEIIEDMAINQLSWTELELKYHVSHNMIAKYRRKAVKELIDIYSLKEKQLQQYILS